MDMKTWPNVMINAIIISIYLTLLAYLVYEALHTLWR